MTFAIAFQDYPCHWGESRIYLLKLAFSILFRKNNGARFTYRPLSFSSSVQLLSRVWLFTTPWTAACQAFLSIINSRSLLKLVSIKSVMPPNPHPLSSPSPPTFNLSQHQGLFKWVTLSWSIEVSASASVPFNEYLGLISSRMDWLDLFAVQGTLKRIFSNPSVQKHQFFGTQLPL